MKRELFHEIVGIKKNFEEGLVIANQIFDALKKNHIKELPSLTERQSAYVTIIQSKKEALCEKIKEIAQHNHIDTDEYKLKDILCLYTQEEKENLLDLVDEVQKLEKEFQRALYRNQDFLSAIIASAEAEIDAMAEFGREHFLEPRVFLNEKF